MQPELKHQNRCDLFIDFSEKFIITFNKSFYRLIKKMTEGIT